MRRGEVYVGNRVMRMYVMRRGEVYVGNRVMRMMRMS